MKRTVYTLCVDNYAPQITSLTFPLLKRFAKKIGANFHVITVRKYPSWPPVYEKVQIYDLGREHGNDWNIYIDADTLVHPDMFDPTTQLNKDTVAFNGKDFSPIRWRHCPYFWRDGRNIGACNWFTMASDWCLDLWHPLDISLEEALQYIHATANELTTVVRNDHLIDDYTLSRNIARYGLKHTTIRDMLERRGITKDPFLWHLYTIPVQQKVVEMKKVLQVWRVINPDGKWNMKVFERYEEALQ